MNITIENIPCIECGSQFASESVVGEIRGVDLKLSSKRCDSCQEAKERSLLEVSQTNSKNVMGWEEICPPVYQDFQIEKLPRSSQTLAGRVLDWGGGSKGIGLFGESRTGKTFILHELMRIQHDAGASVHLTSSVEFAWAMGSLGGERDREMDRCLRADMLLLDDIGKEKLTERVESDLYRVVEQRRRNLKPMFTSVNSCGESLANAMSLDGGWPIVNRLRFDLCEFLRVPELDSPAK
jgi:DNA replication protein DnaC